MFPYGRVARGLVVVLSSLKYPSDGLLLVAVAVAVSDSKDDSASLHHLALQLQERLRSNRYRVQNRWYSFS